MKKKVTLKRHIAKTVTWRLLGTIDTILIGWVVSGNPVTGLKIGGVEVFSKMVLYFIHERLWYKSAFGILNKKVSKKDKTS